MSNMIYKKVEEGMIDVTNECSGVRSGTATPAGPKDPKATVSLGSSTKHKDDQCGC